MSAWQYKLADSEMGPVSFAELASLLREGKITDRVLVRREGSGKWDPAWSIVGLMEAASRPQDQIDAKRESGIRAPNSGSIVYPPTTALAARRVPTELNSAAPARASVAAIAALVVTGLVYRWVYWRTMAFPPPRRNGAVVHWFPLFGECGTLEFALLHADLFIAVAVVAWWLCGRWASPNR